MRFRSQLVEGNIRHIINNSLVKCNSFKTEYYNYIVNLSIFIILILFVSIFIYTNRKSKEEMIEMELEKKQYLDNLLAKYYISKGNNYNISY